MNHLVNELLNCLQLTDAPDDKVERCGLLLSLVVERHSKQKSPDSMYVELLPKPYYDVRLTEAEYTALVAKLSKLLVVPSLPPKSQEALVFAMGGADDRTIQLTIPAIVEFLAVEHEEMLERGALRCLRDKLASSESIRRHAAQIRGSLAPLSKVRRCIELSLQEENEKHQAIATLERLATLLDCPA